MRLSSISCLLVWTAAAVFIAGCGGKSSETTGPPGNGAGPPPKKTIVYTAADLPPLAEYIPVPLDDERVEIAPPQGFILSPRSSTYIVECKRSRKASYPLIRVTAEDYETVFNVSDEATAETFAKQRAAALEGEGVTLVQKVTPLRVANNWGIAYVRQGKSKKNIIDQIFFETVANGRKYTYEMRTLTGHQAEDSRDTLFSMVGGTKFLRPAPAKKPAEEAPDKPAEDAAKQPDAGETP